MGLRRSAGTGCGMLWVVMGLFILGPVAPAAWGHPLSQGTLDVTVFPDHVAMRARVTLEEVDVTNMLVPEATAPATTPADAAAKAYEQHSRYLAAYLRLSGDGRAMTPKVVKITPPAEGGSGPAVARQNQHAVYELEYRPAPQPDGSTPPPPSRIELASNVLVAVEFLPGMSWEASYVVNFRQENGKAVEALLLTSQKPVTFDCAQAAATVDTWRLVRDYAGHGVHHILSGWDHLLFVSALVLAATGLWDLVKVVTAFTLAHTLTLALSALNVVRLPEGIVEPLIAGSIVFVALQNVFWPTQSRGWGRLAAAFFFGLFHGLGFAGGLLEAMSEMSGGTVLLAIAAFSVGVEVGHQVVVLPLFAALKVARQAKRDHEARDRVSLLAQRYGSAVISVAGMFYLFMAVRSSFAGA